MSGFTKLHSTIINSSIWDEPDSVRIVWITLLAMADATGFVESSLAGLAHQSRKTKEETTAALAVLESPDLDSKNPDHEGRRVRRIEGGWVVLNYALYREKAELSDAPEAVATRERVRRHRERKQAERYRALQSVTPASASASASVRPEGIAKGRPASEQEVVDHCATLGLPRSDAEYLWSKWEGNGFTNNGKPMKDWRAVIRSHAKAKFMPSQKTPPTSGRIIASSKKYPGGTPHE